MLMRFLFIFLTCTLAIQAHAGFLDSCNRVLGKVFGPDLINGPKKSQPTGPIITLAGERHYSLAAISYGGKQLDRLRKGEIYLLREPYWDVTESIRIEG